METRYAIQAVNLRKQFKGFELNIPSVKIPKGFSTALIGENGAGKTTLINCLTGLRLDYKGQIRYFDKYTDADREKGDVKEKIGYTGPGLYFMPQWSVKQVEEISEMLFDGFDRNEFERRCKELAIFPSGGIDYGKKVSSLSDGTRMKLMLAGVLARDTEMLILDEPASPLDPLMRDKLCELIHDYIAEGNGEKTVFFSTHNISDMENVTDYAIIMEYGQIVEEGFVEDLKEKYVLIKGDAEDAETARLHMYTMTKNQFGFEGICLADQLDKLAGLDVSKEIPSLYQISVAVMKANTRISMK